MSTSRPSHRRAVASAPVIGGSWRNPKHRLVAALSRLCDCGTALGPYTHRVDGSCVGLIVIIAPILPACHLCVMTGALRFREVCQPIPARFMSFAELCRSCCGSSRWSSTCGLMSLLTTASSPLGVYPKFQFLTRRTIEQTRHREAISGLEGLDRRLRLGRKHAIDVAGSNPNSFKRISAT
jgi:hypothetical protein